MFSNTTNYPTEIWPKIVHNTVVGNMVGVINHDASANPPNFHSAGMKIHSSIMWGNTVDLGKMVPALQVYQCDWESGQDSGFIGNGCIHVNPAFASDGFRLTSSSQCIDKATEMPPVILSLDWDLGPRTVDLIYPETDDDRDMGVDEVDA